MVVTLACLASFPGTLPHFSPSYVALLITQHLRIKSPNDGQTDGAVAQIIFFLLKHQAHSTDIFSTSWQSKEQQKKELEQQRFLFQYNLIQPATAPFHQWGRGDSPPPQPEGGPRKGGQFNTTLVIFEKGYPSNPEHTGLTRKGQTSGQNREGKKRGILVRSKNTKYFV